MSLKNAVLVLNQSYEPLQTVSIEDAFINLFNDKVYVEEYQEDKVYRSANAEWKVPSVVRLKVYKPVNQKRRSSASKRSRIYMRDKYRCGYCGIRGNERELTLDHIVPRSKRHLYSQEFLQSAENLVTCCFKCNQKKRDSMLEDSGMKLLRTPKQLQVGLDKVVVHHWAEVRPNWAKYLYLSAEGDKSYYE